MALIYRIIFLSYALSLSAQVPPLMSYQGRLAAGGTNFDGPTQFKFALVNGSGSVSLWSNDNSSSGGGEPTQSVPLTVTQGLFTVVLGDASLSNMQPIPSNLFTNSDVRLRIWVASGTNSFQLLTPDQRLGAVGYAMISATVPDGALTGAKLAAGSLQASNLANGAVTSLKLGVGSVTSAAIATAAVGLSNFPVPPRPRQAQPARSPRTPAKAQFSAGAMAERPGQPQYRLAHPYTLSTMCL